MKRAFGMKWICIFSFALIASAVAQTDQEILDAARVCAKHLVAPDRTGGHRPGFAERRYEPEWQDACAAAVAESERRQLLLKEHQSNELERIKSLMGAKK